MGIHIRNLRKSFGNNEVLKGIDFDFKGGQVNMIIGASGSGKTVLTKCMVGLLAPDSGTVFYDDIDFYALNTAQLREVRKQIGMLFQSAALFDSMSVEDNVGFPLQMFTNSTPAQIRERVNFCLDKVNLQGVNTRYPSELSGGMKKRVGIARAIALQPKYLFFDEPNSGLDPQTAAVIDELIRSITDEFGTTSIVITHDMNSVLKIADHILFIYQGFKEWEGTRQDVLRANNQKLNDLIRTSGVATQPIN